MSKFAIDPGHGCYPDTGAEGYLNEQNCALDIANRVINKLQTLGHEAWNVRLSNAPSVRNSLQQRCNGASDADLYNKLGAEVIASAIVQGLTGQTVKSSNSNSDFIKSVQHDLQRVSCLESGEVNATGVLDSKTKAAIKQFRSIVGLPDSENIDSQLVNALNAITKKPIIGKEWPSDPIATKFIQWWIGAPKTGIFDEATEKMVKDWEKAARVYWEPDGVIRIESWVKILK